MKSDQEAAFEAMLDTAKRVNKQMASLTEALATFTDVVAGAPRKMIPMDDDEFFNRVRNPN